MSDHTEMRRQAAVNLSTLKPDDSYLADEVLTLSRWIIELLDALEELDELLPTTTSQADLIAALDCIRPLLAPYRRSGIET